MEALDSQQKFDDFVNNVSDNSFVDEIKRAKNKIQEEGLHTILLDKLRHLEYHSWKKFYSVSVVQNDVNEFNENLYEWMNFTIDPKNYTFFTGTETDREDEIRKIIEEPGSNFKKLKVFSKFF
ncbi:hypothetical protein [Candidatus Scalindua japonica]|nr:hypothetical protein [Candidatus Scalindua japonica]